jgi:hypothetical protein
MPAAKDRNHVQHSGKWWPGTAEVFQDLHIVSLFSDYIIEVERRSLRRRQLNELLSLLLVVRKQSQFCEKAALG